MDWKDLAKVIAPLAPVAGSIIGGLIPVPGGSIIGQKLGELIAGAFGVPPTPQAVSEAIANSTEETARAKINAAVEQARVEVTGFVEVERIHAHVIETSLTQVGATMRAEIGHEHWYFNGWRPACGWVFVVYATVFGGILMVAGIAAAFFNSPTALDRLSAAWPIFAAYFGALAAMVGVYIVGRSQEKRTAAETGTTATPPTTTATSRAVSAPAPARSVTPSAPRATAQPTAPLWREPS